MTRFPDNFRYLLVTHIPFARDGDGSVLVDSLWARDLAGLTASLGPIRVAAPEIQEPASLTTWGPTASRMGEGSGITWCPLPAVASTRDLAARAKLRSALRRAVVDADLVHTSNYFPPYLDLAYAHDLADRLGKRTVFTIAEDFQDMLDWEWRRVTAGRFRRWRIARLLHSLDTRIRKSAASASLTFLHTPAAVLRYRLSARHGIAIRQPGHETEDVIGEEALRSKCAAIDRGDPLILIAACRHRPMKGLEFLIRAIAMLARADVRVEARCYGAGETTASLRSLAACSGISDRVSFPGSLPPGADVYRAIAAGHAFVMPHRTTDFGRTFFDAMAGGTPVIAFRTAASMDTVRDGIDGLIAPLDDVEGLAAAIRRLHQDRSFTAAAARAARERALVNTRSAWFGWRAEWIRELFPAAQAAQVATAGGAV